MPHLPISNRFRLRTLLIVLAIATYLFGWGCAKEEAVTTGGVHTSSKNCQVFFSRALSATVDGKHLTIMVLQDTELVDSVYADETNDLPVEIRCESEFDRAVLAFHLTWREDSLALKQFEDERFKLLHIEKELAEPLVVCIVDRSSVASGREMSNTYSISSASIVRQTSR